MMYHVFMQVCPMLNPVLTSFLGLVEFIALCYGMVWLRLCIRV